MIKVLKLKKEAKLPEYATAGAAGMDLCACIEAPLILEPNERALIPTGIAIELPDAGMSALIYARSGLAVKNGITLSNCVGVIDSDYRGEIKIGLINLGNQAFTVKNGDRIAQMVLTPVIRCQIEEAFSIGETERGAGGFGSTGI